MRPSASFRRRQLLIRAATVVIAAAATAAVINVGCADLMGMDPGSPMPDAGAGGGTAGTSAGGSAGAGGQPCELASIPSPPEPLDGGGDVELVLALRRLYVTQTPDGGPVGLDLDGFCTCQGHGPSCLAQPGSDDCDLHGGRDNAFGRVFDVLGALIEHASTGDLFFSLQAEAGEWTLLLRVRGYNGELDDDQVEVAWYASQGIEGAGVPAWDGTDSWRVARKSVEPGPDGGYSWDYPKNVDGTGYVTGGVLVAGLPNAELELRGGDAQLFFTVSAANVMGRLEETAAGWALRDGLVTGRVTETNVFHAIRSLRNVQGGPLCMHHDDYAATKEAVCLALDIHDSVGRTAAQPCEAVSVGMGFEADPAELGAVSLGIYPAPACPPQADPILDSCP